ncbi:MAG: Npt1/Npt2 family nucleotide transporter [Rickettsiaceae bacterium]|nr:Npt1/Npt2 family nucleotide transporter [Rickettsiaceae bacterium]
MLQNPAATETFQGANNIEATEPFTHGPTGIFSRIWPIYNYELPKFFSITALMFCILFIQNVIRATKDSVVNTMIGPESVSFLKVWGVMPAAILYAIIYVKLVNKFKPETLFNIVISAFIGLFLFFGLIVFPYSNYIHLSKESANSIILLYPNFKWFILLGANWGYSLFYVVAELWPNAAYSVLFWQFINSVTNVDESRRFYPMFALFGQTGLYISGSLLVAQTSIGIFLHKNFGLGATPTIASLQFIMFVVIALAAASLLIFRFINLHILDVRGNDVVKFKGGRKKTMGLMESLRLIASSRYILLIAVMLTCYGISINLVEGPWKKMVANMYSSTEDNLAFVGSYLRMTGIITLAFVLVGSNIVRFLGWFSAAIITPFMMFVTGCIFYYSANFESDLLTFICITIGYDPIMLAIVFGAIHNVITKSTKYTLFDSTKEMAYVPLDDDLKTRGKAAVDSISVKFGKSASAFIQSSIFFLFPAATFESICPYLMFVFVIVCFFWMWAVLSLAKQYDKLTSKEILEE